MCGPLLTESLRQAALALGRVSLCPEDMDIWMRQGLVHMKDALQWMIADQPLNAATALRASYGLISGFAQSIQPSPSASKKRGSL